MESSDKPRSIQKALSLALPSWVRVYSIVVGVPCWASLLWLMLADAVVGYPLVEKVAGIGFASVVVLQMLFIFRAFWRNEI